MESLHGTAADTVAFAPLLFQDKQTYLWVKEREKEIVWIETRQYDERRSQK